LAASQRDHPLSLPRLSVPGDLAVGALGRLLVGGRAHRSRLLAPPKRVAWYALRRCGLRSSSTPAGVGTSEPPAG
jgi:hypothetical protein